jgi:sterol O-acyltransferase
MHNHSRQKLQADNGYDGNNTMSSINLDDGSDGKTSTVPLIEITSKHSSSKVKEVGTEEVKLVSKATDEDIYELRTRISVDKRRFNGDGVPKSKLSDVKFSNVQSILDKSMGAPNGEFSGFFNLFWVAVAIIILNITVNIYLEQGWRMDIVNILLTKLVDIALTDLLMYLSIYVVYLIQYAVKKNWIEWERSGWIISSVFEFAFCIHFTSFAEHQQFPWIGKIFLFLHALVLLMKMHSYSFYNGYLWKLKRESEFSTGFLKKIHHTRSNGDLIKELEASIEFCEFELKSQSTTTPFPSNISLKNFVWYTMFPTVVYQIDFPRTPKIRWTYVGEKLAAIFGIISLMIIIAQNMMYPIAMRAIALRELPVMDRIYQYPLLLLNLMPSFVIIYLLVFYLIWDAILNCIAELTRFGDREFYGPWWNCVSWDQFARLWNIPVHKFLLRHVYHSSISAFKLSKTQATLFTFLLSSIIHEGAMFVLFHKVRGYLLFLQMCQLPLVAISKTRFLRDRHILGNVIFWCGIISGPSMMCTLYLTF